MLFVQDYWSSYIPVIITPSNDFLLLLPYLFTLVDGISAVIDVLLFAMVSESFDCSATLDCIGYGW